jgi:DNA-binding MarR family transcriptional regulator
LERLHDPADRRGALVSLTREGLRLIDMAVTTRMVVEETMLRSFSLSDRKKFAELLRTVLQDLEVIKKERHSSVEAGNRQIPQR